LREVIDLRIALRRARQLRIPAAKTKTSKNRSQSSNWNKWNRKTSFVGDGLPGFGVPLNGLGRRFIRASGKLLTRWFRFHGHRLGGWLSRSGRGCSNDINSLRRHQPRPVPVLIPRLPTFWRVFPGLRRNALTEFRILIIPTISPPTEETSTEAT
jgi:hypothetical protein